jgi:DNA-binding beta-propeller fold protein YncE
MTSDRNSKHATAPTFASKGTILLIAAMMLTCAATARANVAEPAHGQSAEPRWTASARWRAGSGPLSSLGYPFTTPFGFGSALVGSAPVGTGPSAVAINPATDTIYVANGYNNDGPNAGGDTVSVIDGATAGRRTCPVAAGRGR